MAAAKVRIPATAPAVLARERLHVLLDAAVAGTDVGPSVTVVCAPAGSGKTTLLATWARQRAGRCGMWIAWVSLDIEDNDPVLLWSAILRALKISGACADGLLDRLAPPSGDSYAVFLAVVVSVLERLPRPVVLVLDGVHDVDSDGAVHTVNILLRNSPATLRVVLAARFPPPFILPRLRLEGRLREIGPDELDFTSDEARHVYAREGVQLTENELDLLMERTEGWAAGLRLAAITLEDSGEPADLIAGFTGDDHVVADYLIGEVIARQPEDVQQFMLSTCVCPTFSADLARALSRQDNAGQILARLERTGILTASRRGSRRCYRYHPLLRSCLRAELGRRQLSTQHLLHRIAAGWYLAAGEHLRAMEHAVAAGDDDQIARLLSEFGLRQILRGQSCRLRRIVDSAPAHVLSRPSVALVAAATAIDLGDVLAADRWLQSVDDATHPLRTQRLRALHATVQLHRSRLDGDVREALAALDSTQAGQTGDHDLDLLALFNHGVAAAWTGRHRTATADLRRALRVASTERRDAVTMQCEAHLAAAAAVDGDLVQLGERARSALALAESRRWAKTSRCAYVHALLGVEAYQRLEDQRARQLTTLAAGLLTTPTDVTIELFVLTLHAMVAFESAEDPHEVTATLRKNWQRLGSGTVCPALVAFAAPAQQRMALRVGEHTWAVEVLERVEALLAPCGEHALLRAILCAHKGRVTSTRRVLGPLLDGRTRPVVASTLIDSWLLEAHLANRSEDSHRAHEALSRALAIAAPQHALRPFRDAGQSVRTLLARDAGRFGRFEPFVADILTAIPAAMPDPTDGLTEREQALLVELPSMRTAEEIASTMFVSVNTVKTHLRGIYRKLGVNHRRDAITVARQRGLLPVSPQSACRG